MTGPASERGPVLSPQDRRVQPTEPAPLQGLPQFTQACPSGASSVLGGLLLEAWVTPMDLVSLVFHLDAEDLVQPRVLSGNL